MRISTNSFYDQATANINFIQTKQLQLQNQVSTGKRMLNPSDDPIASAQLLQLKNSQNINAEYTNTRITTENSLNAVDGIMGNMTDVLTSIKSSITAANKSTLSSTDRKAIAVQLQNDLENLVALGNSKDSNGDYMFAGQSVKTQPFSNVPVLTIPITPYAGAYAGDTSQRDVQVSSSRMMSLSEVGSNFFTTTAPNTAPDIFVTLSTVIGSLNDPSTPSATIASNLAASGATIDTTMENVLTSRASVGARLNELAGLDIAGSALDVQYQQNISNLEDLDYAKALSEISKQSTILDAAQKAFTKTASLSLFALM
jgi:flagellar hook-associated protein 3 FlgL